jgi:dipeptide transport system ATP-binding protein
MSEALCTENLGRSFFLRQGLLGSRCRLRAVNGVSLALKQGETLAIVGESGCGKSTLGRLLALIDTPNEGWINIAGERVLPGNLKRLRPMVQMVFQNPYASLNPRKTLGSILEEPLCIHTRLNRAARQQRVAEMLEQVGLHSEYRRRYPHMFSGGQRQRIAIARAMMLAPRLVIADEPTSALDVSIQAQIINLFRELQSRHGASFIFISHDLGVVRHVAQHIAVMYLGMIVEQAPVEILFKNPLHPYTRALLAAHPALGDRWKTPVRLQGEPPSPLEITTGCPFLKRCPLANSRCALEAPSLRPRDECGVHKLACHQA